MKKLICFFFILIPVITFGKPGGEQFKIWLNQNIRPLSIEENKDSQLIQQSISGKKIILFGKNTYGGSEFALLEQKWFKYLVGKGFSHMFISEMDVTEASMVNDYVQGNDSHFSINQLSWEYQTKETKEFIEWIRNFNLKNLTHIKWVGISLKNPRLPLESLLEYFNKADVEYLRNSYRLISFLKSDAFADSLASLTAPERTTVYYTVNRCLEELKEHRDKFVSMSSQKEFDKQFAYATTLSNLVELNISENFQSDEEKSMLNYLKNSMSVNPSKMYFFSVHNIHAGKRKFDTHKSLASQLTEQFKDSVLSIGCDFYKGTYLSISEKKGAPIIECSFKSDKYAFAEISDTSNVSFLKLDKHTSDPALKSAVIKDIGRYCKNSTRGYYSQINYTEAFDAIILVKELHPLTKL